MRASSKDTSYSYSSFQLASPLWHCMTDGILILLSFITLHRNIQPYFRLGRTRESTNTPSLPTLLRYLLRILEITSMKSSMQDFLNTSWKTLTITHSNLLGPKKNVSEIDFPSPEKFPPQYPPSPYLKPHPPASQSVNIQLQNPFFFLLLSHKKK